MLKTVEEEVSVRTDERTKETVPRCTETQIILTETVLKVVKKRQNANGLYLMFVIYTCMPARLLTSVHCILSVISIFYVTEARTCCFHLQNSASTYCLTKAKQKKTRQETCKLLATFIH